MARSDVNHFGMLDAWARVMHESTWRYNQIRGNGVTVLPGCTDKVFIQYERDYIAAGLNQAIESSAKYLQYYPLPVFVTESLPLAPDRTWDEQTFTTSYGYVKCFGIRQANDISLAQAIVYSDSDSDGVEDLATITVDALVPMDEIGVFFQVSDGAAGKAHERWRIDGLIVVDNDDGTYDITGHKSLFAQPSIWDIDFSATLYRTKNAGDSETPGDFVTAVDVYQITADDSLQPDQTAAVSLLQIDGTRTNVQAYIVDAKNGDFKLGVLESGDPEPVDSVRLEVSYLAGYPLDNQRMADIFESPIIRYANTLFPQTPVGLCDRTRAMWESDHTVLEQAIRDESNRLAYPFTQAAENLWAVIKAFKAKEKKSPGNRPPASILAV